MSVLKSLKIARCNPDGTIVSTPVVVDLCAEAVDLKENPKYTDVNCLLSKTADKQEAGSDPSGSVTVNLTKQSSFLIALLFMGEPDTNVDASANAWASDTVMAVDDIVNHSNGTHSMTVKRVKGDAKTGGTEPTVTSKNGTVLITDNNVIWEVTPLMKKASLTFKDVAPKVAVEYGIDDNGTMFYKRFTGCEVTNLPLKLEVDEKVPQMQLNLAIENAIDSTEAGWTSDLASIAGAKIVKLGKDYYRADDESKNALIDGMAECIESIDLNTDKAIKIKKGLNKCNTSTRELKADGKLALDFTIAQYEKYKNSEKFALETNLLGTGVYSKYTFGVVKAEKTDPSIKTREEVSLEPNIWAVEDENGVLLSAEIVYPAFMDESGAIVEF